MKTTQIELTNEAIFRSLQALERVKLEKGAVPFDVSYTLGLNMSFLRKAVEDYQEALNKIYREHCKLENGAPVMTEDRLDYVYKSGKDKREAIEERDALGDVAISLPLYIYPLSAFEKADIPHTLLEHLLWMITMDS
ncbi:MAG: hypothetical protein KDE19_13545 [Caldilineaceae bacterium]|nr:hypothetical protein [Caldilineaceae bacterium]